MTKSSRLLNGTTMCLLLFGLTPAIASAQHDLSDRPLQRHSVQNAPAIILPNPTIASDNSVGGPMRDPPNLPVPEVGLPNLNVLSVQLVNANNIPISSIPAGQPFWIRVDYLYSNPICDHYQIGRTVNGNEPNLAPAINWGCGMSGNTFWQHVWGGWVLHNEGDYIATINLDAGGTITESSETDNISTLNITVTGGQTDEWEVVGADFGRTALSEGTDVIVGTMDDAFDFLHPWFSGVDSLGRPRLIGANQNVLGVDGSPLNAEHATAVMGIVLARGANPGDITGLAPDARYVTAEFLNRANLPGLTVLDVRDAAGFLVVNGAEVINMSWSWWFGSNANSQSGEGSITNLMADYLSYGLNIVAVPAVNQLGFPTPTAPGAARNVITVGGVDNSLMRVWEPQDDGPTLDGRAKPELLGNDSANAVATSAFWRDGFPALSGYLGTSFAAPFVTGAVAQMIGYAKANNISYDHRAIKAIITNSGIPVLRSDGSSWQDNTIAGLDNEQGTGLLSIQRIAEMLTPGEQGVGSVSVPGFDVGAIDGFFVKGADLGIAQYDLGVLTAPAELRITLATSRPTFWSDGNGNNQIDHFDSFFTSPVAPLDNFDIELLRNGALIAVSNSPIDSVEHIRIAQAQPGQYQLRVKRQIIAHANAMSELYGLAWWSNGQFIDVPADLNSDGVVNGADLATLLTQWGTNGPADLNSDGVVNGADLAQLLTNWGPVQ